MSVYIDDGDFQLHLGDVRSALREMPDESVHCVVTSPPYWGLRDYGTGEWDGGDPGCEHRVRENHDAAGTSTLEGGKKTVHHAAEGFGAECPRCGARRVDRQIGLEPTPEEYVATMVGVFREVRRVLRRDGTCWLNLGDSYNNNGYSSGGNLPSQMPTYVRGRGRGKTDTLKPKDLVGIPWRVAFALQADGWWLRSDIIWSKPNPMPESVTDRPTKSHEYVFLLTRSARYFFDAYAVREPAEWARWGDQTYSPEAEAMYGQRIKARPKEHLRVRNVGGRTDGLTRGEGGAGFAPNPSGRNLRSVWEIATQPYPEAHFATYPEALVERCVKAGTSERGCCPECGAPWERETDVSYENPGNRTTNGPRSVEARDGPMRGTINSRGSRLERRAETTGWRPTCGHDLPPVPCVILDPFLGAGTTALVARRLGRRSIGIELSEDYARLAARRLQQLSLLAEPA